MKETKNYICVVDGHRRSSRQRNTSGRYRVGARSEKEAKELLQKAIGFGSVQVYYEDKKKETMHLAKQGECLKETGYYGGTVKRMSARHANSPLQKKSAIL